MAKIEVTGDGGCGFSVISISLALQILNNQPLKLSPEFLQRFSEYYPHFKPATEENFKAWIKHFVKTKRDAEILITPAIRYCHYFNKYKDVDRALKITRERYNKHAKDKTLEKICRHLGIGLHIKIKDLQGDTVLEYEVTPPPDNQPMMRAVFTPPEHWDAEYNGLIPPGFISTESELKLRHYRDDIVKAYEREYTTQLKKPEPVVETRDRIESQEEKNEIQENLVQLDNLRKLSITPDASRGYSTLSILIALQLLNNQPLKLSPEFLQRFSEYYSHFKPATEENFKAWIKHFVKTKRDAEVLIAPMLRYWHHFNELRDVKEALKATEKNYKIYANDNEMSEICAALGLGLHITETIAELSYEVLKPKQNQPVVQAIHANERWDLGCKANDIPIGFDSQTSELLEGHYKNKIENIYNKDYATQLQETNPTVDPKNKQEKKEEVPIKSRREIEVEEMDEDTRLAIEISKVSFKEEEQIRKLTSETHQPPNILTMYQAKDQQLWNAASQGNWPLVTQLLKKGGQDLNFAPSTGENKGLTTLWFALRDREWNLAAELLINGAKAFDISPAQGDYQGQTELWFATYYQQWDIVDLLMKRGAKNIDAGPANGGCFGQTVLSVAESHKKKAIFADIERDRKNKL